MFVLIFVSSVFAFPQPIWYESFDEPLDCVNEYSNLKWKYANEQDGMIFRCYTVYDYTDCIIYYSSICYGIMKNRRN